MHAKGKGLPDREMGCSGPKSADGGRRYERHPALAAASVSASPATAADVSQTVADLVFQGAKLQPIALALQTARRAKTVMRQNLALAIGYNVIMVPLAIAGWVTPWLAAVAMSSSSVLVMANSLRTYRSPKP
jgi:P-type Cu2+ transporter